MKVLNPQTAPDYGAGELRSGTLISKVLGTGYEGTPNSYRLSFETAGADEWATPRHRHNFDQVRLQISGSFDYAKGKSLTAGWVGYFPESMHYGPQRRDAGSSTLVLQFGGASGLGFMSPRERRIGYDALIEKGKFEGGAYTYFDEKGQKHNRDSYEAVWEYMNKRPMEYPEPRYDSLINMNPAHYNWIADPTQPGVSWKRLGTFTERQFEVGFLRIQAGCKAVVTAHVAPQFLFVQSGAVTCQGQSGTQHSAFTFERNETPGEVAASAHSELYFIRMPNFSDWYAAREHDKAA